MQLREQENIHKKLFKQLKKKQKKFLKKMKILICLFLILTFCFTVIVSSGCHSDKVKHSNSLYSQN